MSSSIHYRAAAALAAVALAACSDTLTQPTTPSRQIASINSPSFVITPALSDVIVGSGTFANAIVPTQAGRATGAFWDNVSSDNGGFPSANHCNVGFFAVGTIGPTCNFTAAGSAPGGFANYYGSGAGNLGSPDFMFKGKYSYDVTLKGAYSFGLSTVGWFTVSGGVYTLHAVPQWGGKSIGTTVTVNTLGLDWGFFASNTNFTGTRTCGATTNTTCSDATGGFVAQPFQQHALFINAAGDQFLVGLEDNLLGLWAGDNPVTNPTNQDSDYNDYIFNVVPHVIETPQICDFITFGRLVTTVGNDKIVISGNAGGNAPGGGILGTIEISVGGTQYHVPTIESYGLPTNAPLFGDPFARVITGHSGNHLIELRLRDDPAPGQGEPGTAEGDKVWLKIDNTVVVHTQSLDQGNIQLHLHCRGPGE